MPHAGAGGIVLMKKYKTIEISLEGGVLHKRTWFVIEGATMLTQQLSGMPFPHQYRPANPERRDAIGRPIWVFVP